MDRFIQFLIFFVIISSVFGFMQWYVIRSYFRWVRLAFAQESVKKIRTITILLLIAANILFFLRFPSTELGWYEHTLFQAVVIYPGGIFFGAVVLAFLILLPFNTSAFFYRIVTRISTYLDSLRNRIRGSAVNRSQKQHENAPSETAASADETFASETELNDHSPADSFPVSQSSGAASGSAMSDFISRRDFIKTTGTVLSAAPLGITVMASAATAHDYQITRKTLYYPDLPSGLEGLRIAQLSDIHSGIYMTENQMRDIFRLTNEENPHLVTITGDLVDNSVSEIPALYRALEDLKAEYGIYACLGNHDHYASAGAVSDAMIERGLHMLTNTHESIAINDETVSIFGVDDHESGSPKELRMQNATANMPEHGFRVLLSHRPDLFDDARNYNIQLTLAGHTHGGQVGFDVLGMPFYPIHLFHEYAKGLYDYGAHKAYVNVGIGMVGAPVRLVKPELSVFELTGNPGKAAS